MAEQRKAKKKKVWQLPPDVQEYLSGTGTPQWSGETLPQEYKYLSPQAMFEEWSSTETIQDPITKEYFVPARRLYHVLLGDYLQAKLENGTLSEDDVDRILKQAEIKEKINTPLASMPLYVEVREAVRENPSPRFWDRYNRTVESELIDLNQKRQAAETARYQLFGEQEAYQAAEAKRELYEQYQPFSKAARPEGELGDIEGRLQREKVLGIPGMTPSASMSEGERRQLLNYVETQERELIDAANRGEITQAEATARMREINQTAYGVGSQFEKWQHELVGDTGVPKYPPDLQGREAQEMGAKKATDFQTQQLKQSRLLGMLYPEQMARFQAELRAGWGQAAGSGSEALGRGRFVIPAGGEEGTAEGGGGIGGIGGSFTGTGGGGTYIPNYMYEQGFADWAKTNPEFQKAQSEREIKMWAEYPGSYPAYQSYIQAFQPTGLEGAPDLPLTFEKWQVEDTQGKLLSEEDIRRKQAIAAAAKGRLAPLTVNR